MTYQGKAKDEFQNLSVEDHILPLDDETQMPTDCANDEHVDENSDLNALLDYLQGKPTNNSFIAQLDAAVKEAKQSEKNRRDYMTYQLELQKEFDEGVVEGVGLGRLNQLFDLVNDGDLTLKKAASKTKLTVQEFEDKLNNYNSNVS